MNIISFLKLVEIQTKVASMIPFLLGTTYVLYRFSSFNTLNFILMLVSLLSFDMTTTALNNYIDYKKAIKKHGFGYESHNAIVRYGLKEGTVVAVIVTMISIAVAAGIMLYINTGLVVLILGAISFGIGILYSFGPIPISRTPFGEFFSGFTMGFVITFLAAYIHLKDFGFIAFFFQDGMLNVGLNLQELLQIMLISVLPICGIANIMLANNICDIEDDIANRRYTLPVYVGRENALLLFKFIYYIGYLAVGISLLLGIVPLLSALVFLTLIIVNNNIKEFNKLQTKEKTFSLSVKNFIIINVAFVFTIALGIIFKNL
ncbi:MAG: 1,4-dihydroxy-2-naphthoate polyprenyltransferase [Clostridia bacterium]|jgi:1,4-dihydroxy-2-naphthoate octaprenyltransferase|nr:1,4-dihydroxy-2-naphthoate polyprenyltransferase [Clostridia bacterium]